jgi:uncharacterized oligopeptide transporter (OPT) family protein
LRRKRNNTSAAEGILMRQPQPSAPQQTAHAIVFAIVLATILSGGELVPGLFAGMTIASTVPSAVVCTFVLWTLGGRGIL